MSDFAATEAFRKTHKHPKVYRLEAPEVKAIKQCVVSVTEKIDGSQIGFGWVDGQFIIRSKETRINPAQPTGLFANAAKCLFEMRDSLPKDRFFYGECLNSVRHNKLRYGRVPANHVIIFAVTGEEGKLEDYSVMAEIASQCGFECVPLLYQGSFDEEKINALVGKQSVLGGVEAEGVVIKGSNGDELLCAKIVREDFKEVNNKRLRLQKQGDERLEEFFESFATEARWDKAKQHLAERGELEGKSSDLGKIIAEVNRDIEAEEETAIKEFLYKHFRKQLLKRATAGIPAWFFGKKG